MCEVALSDGLDVVAKDMEFGQGWNSPSHTKLTRKVQYLLPIYGELIKLTYSCVKRQCKIFFGQHKFHRLQRKDIRWLFWPTPNGTIPLNSSQIFLTIFPLVVSIVVHPTFKVIFTPLEYDPIIPPLSSYVINICLYIA